MKIMRSLLAVAAVTLMVSHAAFATPAPEIDPGMGAGALALVGSAILVIRGRRKV